jgi:SAM-dependent methyltransferase
MLSLGKLTRRNHCAEIMDEPDLDPDRHVAALIGLSRINSWSGSARIIWRPLRQLLRDSAGRIVRVVDVATGAGDIPLWLWTKAERTELPLEIEGWDISPTAVQHARTRAAAMNAHARFFQRDVLAQCAFDDFDAVICSLFLHHLDEDQAVDLLGRMAGPRTQLLVVNDLRRSFPGWMLAYAGTRLLSSSDVVRTDGPRSVESAFSLAEVRRLAARAGLKGAHVSARWPCRLLLTWRPSR